MRDLPAFPLPSVEEAMTVGENLGICELRPAFQAAVKASPFIAYFLNTRSHEEEIINAIAAVYAAGKISGVRAERSKRRGEYPSRSERIAKQNGRSP